MNTDKLRESIYSQKHSMLRELLVSARHKNKSSQKSLAKKMGVHHSLIGKIEIGERKLNVLEFLNYCEALDIDPFIILKTISGKG